MTKLSAALIVILFASLLTLTHFWTSAVKLRQDNHRLIELTEEQATDLRVLRSAVTRYDAISDSLLRASTEIDRSTQRRLNTLREQFNLK